MTVAEIEITRCKCEKLPTTNTRAEIAFNGLISIFVEISPTRPGETNMQNRQMSVASSLPFH